MKQNVRGVDQEGNDQTRASSPVDSRYPTKFQVFLISYVNNFVYYQRKYFIARTDYGSQDLLMITVNQ